MKDGLFHFKRFSVAHAHSSMKVGVDAVLIGAWADSQGDSILDVGTGCGVIALMMAQRNPAAKVMAIDVDGQSVGEASYNFIHSPWGDRLSVLHMSFADLSERGDKFDRIVSNPPYFDAGVTDFTTPRNLARHQGALSPSVLIHDCRDLLSEGGRLSMIVPAEFYDSLIAEARDEGLSARRVCFVKGTPRKRAKRVMMEFCSEENRMDIVVETLTMFDCLGNPTEEYRLLEKEFYLKF